MPDLLAARAQMGLSLAFHIVFAAIGIALPGLMVVSEAVWLRRRDEAYLHLTQAWAKGAAIFFAVGAVSGTVLSFELGLLWPRFMEKAGALIGMPFSLEGFAFFTEAIFLGIYLYGWNRVSPRAHLLAGVVIAVSGAASALFVIAVNGWMNAPTGFTLGADGEFLDVDPIAAMANPFWIPNTVHMLIAAFLATAFGAAGIHAWRLLREPNDRFHRAALRILLPVGAATALVQPLSGDFNARRLYHFQPAKLAAMEGQFFTEGCAPLRIGGIPVPESEETRYALEIPCGLSLLAAHDPEAVVLGLEAFPEDARPDPRPVHLAFQAMVAIGFFLLGIGVWAIWILWRRGGRFHEHPRFLWVLVVAAPLGFIAIEAGWMVTELGRQPWIIYGLMRVEDAVAPVRGLAASLTAFTVLYVLLAFIVAYLVRRQVVHAPRMYGRTGGGAERERAPKAESTGKE